jgi:hypothetical protein
MNSAVVSSRRSINVFALPIVFLFCVVQAAIAQPLTATPGSSEITCLDSSAPAAQHFKSAKADPRYADCYLSMASEHIRLCKNRLDNASVEFRICVQTAIALQDFGVAIQIYHAAAAKCAETHLPADCKDKGDKETMLLTLAQGIAGN